MADRSYAVQARTRRVAAQPLVLALVVAGGVGAYSFRSFAGPPDLPQAAPPQPSVPAAAQVLPPPSAAPADLPVPSFMPSAPPVLAEPVASVSLAAPSFQSRRFAPSGSGRISGVLGVGPGTVPIETPIEVPIAPPVVPVAEPAAMVAVPVSAPIVPTAAPILPEAVTAPAVEAVPAAALAAPVEAAPTLAPAAIPAPLVPAETPTALTPPSEPVAEAPAPAPVLRSRSIPRQARAQVAPVRTPVAYAPAAAPAPRAAPAALPEVPAYSRYRYADGALQFAMPTRIGEAELGTLPIKIGAGDDVSVRLGDLLAKVQSRMDPAVYERLSASASASEYVTFSALRAAGIDVRYDSARDEIVFGKV